METEAGSVIIRPGFMKIFHDGCRSAILDLTLSMLADKAKEQSIEDLLPGNALWSATAEDITFQLLNTWGISKVRQEIQFLIDQRIVGKSSNATVRTDRTRHFFFGIDEGARFREVCDIHGVCISHHLDLSPNVLLMLQSVNAINDCCCFITSTETIQQYIMPSAEINEDREQARIDTHLGDAIKAGLDATLTLEEWLVTLKDFNYRCAYCQRTYELLEHFIPVVLGGGTTQSNCIPACYKCNNRKGTQHPLLMRNALDMLPAIQAVKEYLDTYK